MVKTKVKYECEHCGKVLRNARALAGHLWFAHQKRPGEKASLKENVALLEREKGINPDTVEKIKDIHERVNGYEKILKELVEALYQVVKTLEEKIQTSEPKNPDNPTEVKTTDEDDELNLPDIITPLRRLFGSEDKEETDEDDKGWFL